MLLIQISKNKTGPNRKIKSTYMDLLQRVVLPTEGSNGELWTFFEKWLKTEIFWKFEIGANWENWAEKARKGVIILWGANDHLRSCLPISQRRISCVPAPISYNLASLSSRPVGYSLMYPFPPRAWRASRATSVPHLEAKQMTLAQSRLVRCPASTMREQLQSMAREACSLVYISASLPCMSWKWPMGWPNCVRVFMYSCVTSKADCMMPTGPAARTSRSQSSPLMSTQTPRLTCPSTFSSGTSTSSKTSSPVFEPRMPSLSSFCATEKPLVPFSTRKVVMPLSLSSGLVFAQTTITSASGPLVIHILEPLSTYLLPRFSARSFMAVTSEPAPGSDMARAPTCSPLHSFGRYFCFCASEPWRAIWPRQRAVCAPQESPTDPLAREISSMIMEWAVQESSEPPYCAGTVAPSSPISPNSRQRWAGKLSSLSTFCAMGAMRSSANLRTVAWRAERSESKPAICRKLVVENLRRLLVSSRMGVLQIIEQRCPPLQALLPSGTGFRAR